ncbi:MAG: hypothetical protein SGBAC_008053 [Bacillariaceae sp.]
MLFTANASYGDWETAQAKVMNTTYCGTYRRKLQGREDDMGRKIQQDTEDSDKLKKNRIFDIGKIPHVQTRSGSFLSFSLQEYMDEDSSDDSYDDSEDESVTEKYDIPVAFRKPSSARRAPSSNISIASSKSKNVPRRRTQETIHSVQRRTKAGGIAGGAAGGAAAGYYVGSHNRHNSHSSSSRNTPQYSVTYSFTTLDGQQVTATTDYCTNPVPPVGATENILYDPESPAVGAVSEGHRDGLQWGGASMLVFGLIAVCIMGGCMYGIMRGTGWGSSTAATKKPQYGEPPAIALAQVVPPTNTNPISYTSAAYKPP